MDAIVIRKMVEGDLPSACELRRLANWNQRSADWQRLLQLEPNGCFVATQEGTVIGSVTTTIYGQALAWIGMMLVHPEHRRQGIGLRLMNRALEFLRGRGVECIKLDATPAGFPLYEPLGFVTEWNLTRWQRAQGVHTISPANAGIQVMTDADWDVVYNLDMAGFGVPRPQLLRSLAQDSREAFVWVEDGQVAGWALLRPGENADYLGPMACATIAGVLPLAAALLSKTGGRVVFWDIPDQNEPARNAAHQFGFAPVRPLFRMRLGPESVPSNPQPQFAIADPAVG